MCRIGTQQTLACGHETCGGIGTGSKTRVREPKVGSPTLAATVCCSLRWLSNFSPSRTRTYGLQVLTVVVSLLLCQSVASAQAISFLPGTESPAVTMGSSPATTVFNGKLYLAFRSNDSRNILFVTSSSDGIHFGAATEYYNIVMGSAPALAVYNGQLYVGFQANDASHQLFLSSSSDGVTFRPATGYPGIAIGGAPSLGVFNNKLIVGFQANDASHRFFLATSSDGVNFSTTAYPNILMGSSPSLAVFNNQLFVAFQANDAGHALFVSASSDGVNFPSATGYPNIQIGSAPSLAASNGALYVAFSANDSSNALFMSASTTGTNFPSATRSPYDSVGAAPSAASFKTTVAVAFKSNSSQNVLYATDLVPPVNNYNLPTIPLFINDNARTGTDLYVSIVGMVNNVWYSVTDAIGDIQPTAYSPTPASFAVDVGTAATTTIAIPQMVGMRVYVSFGAPLYVSTSPSGAPGTPAGWVPNDPNYNTLFDWAELTWAANVNGSVSALGGNVTQVDMFGLAMQLTLNGLQGDLVTPATTSSGFPTDLGTTARQSILYGIAGAGTPWNSLVLQANGSPLRVIAPYHGIENNVFPSNQLDGYIASVFSQYAGGGLAAQSDGAVLTGRTSSGSMVFINSASGASFSIPKPTTYGAYLGSIAPSPAPTDPTLLAISENVSAQLQGALMRTDLLINGNLTACQPGQFYQGAPINRYAQVIHAQALNNVAYAFGYDDTCNQSSYIVVYAPTSMTLSVGPL